MTAAWAVWCVVIGPFAVAMGILVLPFYYAVLLVSDSAAMFQRCYWQALVSLIGYIFRWPGIDGYLDRTEGR